ncbi:hypothetical protein D777_00484 [Marinobacter nitratireducens]|uniref:Protein containing tetratricopeptide repeat n=1 Tax=Marinobacter nitratireducens TaxID=1137280 RepID=A0A072N6M1_9GAMM|nr:hypothetical protein [Marinobacter nitratireducens]KEF32922.1 hypothetical protein D777_00484 [Marinobacter nitratireducens]
MTVLFNCSRLARGLVLTTLFLAGQAHALAPEHETRRLMLATEDAVSTEKWNEAAEYLNRLQMLEGEKPADYYYYRGRVMFQANHLNEAQSALEQYVGLAGTDGSHYQESLKLITDIEKTRKANAVAPQAGNGQTERVAVIEPAGQQSLESLRKLYLADSNGEALTLHLNSLLEVSGWRQDQGVVQIDKPADIGYRVNINDNTINVQEIRRDGVDVMRRTQPISVYGVNPQVEWSCEPAAGACWVYDPRDGSRLFQLALGREQAREVAHTLGRLIKLLQSPSDS